MQSQSVQAPPHARSVFKNILLATDFADTSQMAQRATRLVSDACTTPKSSSSTVGSRDVRPCQRREQPYPCRASKDGLSRGAPLAGLRHEVLVETGDILSVISGLVERYGVDLVVRERTNPTAQLDCHWALRYRADISGGVLRCTDDWFGCGPGGLPRSR
jgi:hypothetical protein